jgi:Tol biopolymer transport system component/DNA-binding winged helix-turn-helix (wHTH) protein
MSVQQDQSSRISFGPFDADLQTQELRKHGTRLRLPGQSFQILKLLLERKGNLVTRDELRQALWPADTYVDFEHGVNAAVNRLREILGDSADSPHLIETLPRRGYRFIGPIRNDHARSPFEVAPSAELPFEQRGRSETQPVSSRNRARRRAIAVAVIIFAGVSAFAVYRWRIPRRTAVQRTLTRLTFDAGLQVGATWSPDGRSIAYSSDRSGKFDIWVQQVSGGNAVQITSRPGQNWQPDWSPDGKYIAFRSEQDSGGLFVVPAFGGEGLERRITTFGYFPRWSPDGLQILFQTSQSAIPSHLYIVGLDGAAPREILKGLTPKMHVVSAAWHPDGKRISVWRWNPGPAPLPSFSTVPLTGGTPVESAISPEILKMAEVASGAGIVNWGDSDFRFSWDPSGKAIYFERTFHGAKNIWRMSVDHQTLRAAAVERMTTGPGFDTELSLSPDGKKLAFTGGSHLIRTWLFPFDSAHGRITGTGQPASSPGVQSWRPVLSPDGKQLAFCGFRAGQWDLWTKLLPDGPEKSVGDDGYTRDLPQWSPDGTHLAYLREDSTNSTRQLMLWSNKTRDEEPLAPPTKSYPYPYDWSPDGKWLLTSQVKNDGSNDDIWLVPLASRPNAQHAARRIISSPIYDLYEGHISPNSQWIVFETIKNQSTGNQSAIYASSAAGGPWIPVTDGSHWDDKPHWSPDGKTIYFLTERDGFFNVWGIRFDPDKGAVSGQPFQVTSFSTAAQMIAKTIPTVGLSIAKDRLAVTVAQASGNIWILDNLNQ